MQAPSWLLGDGWRGYLLCSLIYLLLALFCIELSRQPGNIATLWLANAWLTACLLSQPARCWPGLLLAAGAANLAANLLLGDSAATSLSFLPANLLESLFAGLVLGRVGGWRDFDRSPRAMLRLLIFGGLLPPALGACLGAATLAFNGAASFALAWPSWFAGSAIGSCSFLPLGLLLLRDRDVLATLLSTPSLLLTVLTVVIDGAALHWLPYPFVYVTIAITLAAALLGTAGAVLPVLIGTVACSAIISVGYFQPTQATSGWHSLSVYVPFLLTIIPPLLLGAITQQSRDRERAMLLSENQFRGAFETASHGIALVSLEGRWLTVNPALCQMLGYSEEHLLKTDFQALTHPDDLQTDLAQVERLLRGELQTYQMEKRYFHCDGHLVWVLLSVSLVRDDGGRPVHFVSQVQDITDTRHNADILTRLNDRLSHEVALSEQRRSEIEAMFTLAPGALLVVNDAGRIVRANESAHEMFQYDQGTLHGELIESLIPESERSSHVAQRTAFIAQEHARPRFMSPNRDFAARRRDGSQFPAEVAIGPILVEGRRGAIAFVLDVSERRRHQTALEEARRVAEAASRAKSVFVANMSHEIRTPMNAILGMVQLLQQTELTYRQADYVEKTDSAARTLLGILDDILDFSKIEAGKLTLDIHPFDLDKVLRNIGVILSASVGKKDLEILFDVDPNVPRQLRGDALRLQQVLINLGGNAIKFTEQGEVILAIRLLSGEDGRLAVHFSVRDTGIGISEEQASHIFEGFSQAEASTTRRFGGTGLGLAISQRLVSMMGGTLEMESTAGEGSSFFFTLPLESVADTPVMPPGGELPRGLNVLVVDDNASAREVIAGMVGGLGWQAQMATNGSQALQLLTASVTEGRPFDVVFIDWRMPGMDGWETSLRIRQLDTAGRPPLIVMVTVYGREMLAQKVIEEQSLLDGFLVKPITTSMLIDAVNDARASMGRQPEPVRHRPVNQLRLRGLHLLVVEDNLTNQQVARELLSNEGAEVAVASGGHAAIEAIQEASQPFDGVLMDIQMPDMDGYEATRVIRNQLGLTTLPIIAMTANAMASDREACLAVGMNDHVGKPFDVNQLIVVLLQHIAPQAAAPSASTAPGSQFSSALLQQAYQAGIDVKTALGRFGTHQHIYCNALRNYLIETTQLAGQLGEHASREELEPLCRILHSLKGLTATIGAEQLASRIKRLEQAVRERQLSKPLAEEIAKLQEALQQMRPMIEVLAAQWASRTAQAAAPELDNEALRNGLRKLLRQLEATSLEAPESFAALQAELAQRWPEQHERLARHIGQLDFRQALPVCLQLLDTLAEQAA
ncbi:response regulator [Chitinimonas sp.]|uniref:response regulator n=1 Tax=Chitinimonas sp. TaxID=1934313 RepID=UPI002F91C4B5